MPGDDTYWTEMWRTGYPQRSPTPLQRLRIQSAAMGVPDRSLELSDADPAIVSVVAESELTGGRTLFLRGGRPVAVLLSHDEYLALRETVAIAADEPVRAAIVKAEEAAARGDLWAAEDLFVE